MPYVAGVLLLAVMGFMLLWPQSMIQEAEQEECNQSLARHPVKIVVINHYADYIYVNVDYTWGTVIPSETWRIKPGVGKVIVYTRHLFTTQNNVTVTLTAYSLEQKILPDKPIKFSLLTTKLVYDYDYHADIRSTWTSTTSNLDLKCTSSLVFDGPLFVLG